MPSHLPLSSYEPDNIKEDNRRWFRWMIGPPVSAAALFGVLTYLLGGSTADTSSLSGYLTGGLLTVVVLVPTGYGLIVGNSAIRLDFWQLLKSPPLGTFVFIFIPTLFATFCASLVGLGFTNLGISIPLLSPRSAVCVMLSLTLLAMLWAGCFLALIIRQVSPRISTGFAVLQALDEHRNITERSNSITDLAILAMSASDYGNLNRSESQERIAGVTQVVLKIQQFSGKTKEYVDLESHALEQFFRIGEKTFGDEHLADDWLEMLKHVVKQVPPDPRLRPLYEEKVLALLMSALKNKKESPTICSHLEKSLQGMLESFDDCLNFTNKLFPKEKQWQDEILDALNPRGLIEHLAKKIAEPSSSNEAKKVVKNLHNITAYSHLEITGTLLGHIIFVANDALLQQLSEISDDDRRFRQNLILTNSLLDKICNIPTQDTWPRTIEAFDLYVASLFNHEGQPPHLIKRNQFLKGVKSKVEKANSDEVEFCNKIREIARRAFVLAKSTDTLLIDDLLRLVIITRGSLTHVYQSACDFVLCARKFPETVANAVAHSDSIRELHKTYASLGEALEKEFPEGYPYSPHRHLESEAKTELLRASESTFTDSQVFAAKVRILRETISDILIQILDEHPNDEPICAEFSQILLRKDHHAEFQSLKNGDTTTLISKLLSKVQKTEHVDLRLRLVADTHTCFTDFMRAPSHEGLALENLSQPLDVLISKYWFAEEYGEADVWHVPESVRPTLLNSLRHIPGLYCPDPDSIRWDFWTAVVITACKKNLEVLTALLPAYQTMWLEAIHDAQNTEKALAELETQLISTSKTFGKIQGQPAECRQILSALIDLTKLSLKWQRGGILDASDMSSLRKNYTRNIAFVRMIREVYSFLNEDNKSKFTITPGPVRNLFHRRRNGLANFHREAYTMVRKDDFIEGVAMLCGSHLWNSLKAAKQADPDSKENVFSELRGDVEWLCDEIRASDLAIKKIVCLDIKGITQAITQDKLGQVSSELNDALTRLVDATESPRV